MPPNKRGHGSDGTGPNGSGRPYEESTKRPRLGGVLGRVNGTEQTLASHPAGGEKKTGAVNDDLKVSSGSRVMWSYEDIVKLAN